MKDLFRNSKLDLNVALVLFLIVSSIVLISFATSYAFSVKNSNFRTFSVSAEGKAIATPDVAQFTFTVFTRGGADVAESESENAQRVAKVMTFLRDSGVSNDDIKTEVYSVEPRYTSVRCENGVCPPSEIEGYTVTQTNSVKVRDFTDVSDLLAGVASLNVDSLSQLSFVIDNKIEYENLARAEAISNAEQKARGIANAAGFKLGRITSVYEDNYFAFDMGGRSGSMADSTSFSRVSAEVLQAPMMDDVSADLLIVDDSSSFSEINPGTSEIKVRMTLNYSIR